MKRRLGPAFWIESVLASSTAFLTILTLVWRDWIEAVFGFDPDRHNGSLEWTLVVACGLVTVLFSALARREWRRAPLKAASAGLTGT
jgi:hypothetical protein